MKKISSGVLKVPHYYCDLCTKKIVQGEPTCLLENDKGKILLVCLRCERVTNPKETS